MYSNLENNTQKNDQFMHALKGISINLITSILVILVGDTGVGKTSLLSKYSLNNIS